MGVDQVVAIGVEEMLSNKALFGVVELLLRLEGHAQVRIKSRPRNIILQLQNQRRHQVDRLVQLGIALEQKHQIQVVFGAVEPDPRQAILASNAAFVERLMLVPDDCDVEGMSHEFNQRTSAKRDEQG